VLIPELSSLRALCLNFIFNIMLAINSENLLKEWDVVAQWDRVAEGATFSSPVQTGPWAQPASNTMGTGYFSGENSRDIVLTTHPI